MATPHLALDRQAASTPSRRAVVASDGTRDYHWLATAADRVARALAQRDRGAEGFGHIGVVRRPTAGFVAAVVGCSKAGMAFSVVDDPSRGSGLPAAVSAVLDVGPAGEVGEGTVDISAVPGRRHVPADRIGVLRAARYRSGSQIAAFDAGDWVVDRFALDGRCRTAVLAYAPDLLTSALSSTFHAGATLLVPDTRVDAWLRETAATVLYLTAPILRDPALRQSPSLSHLFVKTDGGLVPHDIEAARRLAPNARVVMLYRLDADGRPAAVYEAPRDGAISSLTTYAPLGSATPTSHLRVLDESGRPAAIGEPGEIWVAGRATGDRGLRDHDGNLRYAGRIDADPSSDSGHTLTALREFPGVRDALVREHRTADGRTVLLGYVAGPDPRAGTAALRGFLATRLPRHLVPEHLFVLAALARTIDGDYDAAALPTPDDTPTASHVPHVAPSTPTERRLAAILTELLAIGRIGVHESFFDLGGVSVLAPRLVARIRKELDVDLEVRQIFERPTIEGLAQVVADVKR